MAIKLIVDKQETTIQVDDGVVDSLIVDKQLQKFVITHE